MKLDRRIDLLKLAAGKVCQAVVNLLTELLSTAEMVRELVPPSEMSGEQTVGGADDVALEFAVRLVGPLAPSLAEADREVRAANRLATAVRGLKALLVTAQKMPKGASIEDVLRQMATDTEHKFKKHTARDYQNRVRAGFKKGKLSEEESVPLLAICI